MPSPIILIMKLVLVFWIVASVLILSLFAWECLKDALTYRRERKAARNTADRRKALFSDNLKSYR